MQIELELDNGFVCDFAPDFRVQTNATDEANLSWRLSNRKSEGNVAVLFPEFSDEGTLYSITPDGDDV